MISAVLNQALFTPLRAMRLKYVPLLMIYFAYGATSISTIGESFFVKDQLDFSAEAMMAIAVWYSMPWTIKMVFGQLVDSVPLFGSLRASYVFIAAGMMTVGSLMLMGLAGHWVWLNELMTPNALYLAASLITVTGVVVQDVVADATSVEVVSREGRSEAEIKEELGMVQVLGRLSYVIASFLTAGIGGWLATHYSYETIFGVTLIIPVISVIGILFVKIDLAPLKKVNWVILGGGLIYAAFVLVIGFSDLTYKQELIFVVSLAVVIYLLGQLARPFDRATLKKIILLASVIFIYRAMPSIGPAMQWWEIDDLGFNPSFFGLLAQISTALVVIGMWFFAKPLTEKPIAWILVVLSVLGFLLSLPMLGMYYGLHHWTESLWGFGARTIALVDTAVSSPFVQLSMVPLLTFNAIYAPKGNAATWFALMASLMNLAITASHLMTKALNQVWVVTRAVHDAAGVVIVQADYSQLGKLMWTSILLNLIVPIAAVAILLGREGFRSNGRVPLKEPEKPELSLLSEEVSPT